MASRMSFRQMGQGAPRALRSRPQSIHTHWWPVESLCTSTQFASPLMQTQHRPSSSPAVDAADDFTLPPPLTGRAPVPPPPTGDVFTPVTVVAVAVADTGGRAVTVGAVVGRTGLVVDGGGRAPVVDVTGGAFATAVAGVTPCGGRTVDVLGG